MGTYGVQHPGPTAPTGFQQGTPTAPAKRPTVLTVAVVGGVLVGVLNILAAVLVMTTGQDAIAKATERLLGDTLDLVSPEVRQNAIDEAHSALMLKAWAALVPAALVVLFALLSWSAATWARVVLAVFLVGGICGAAPTIAETEIIPAGIAGVQIVAALLSVAVVVLLFLPPVNRYAKARKAA
jgi:hypothetical protein